LASPPKKLRHTARRFRPAIYAANDRRTTTALHHHVGGGIGSHCKAFGVHL
jgi:hypothetical protein